MSGKIKALTKDVINKIAAGEVVENPSSIVKELLDNAIDAKAINITLEIEEGGIKKILILDNGQGMTPEDVKLSIEPHTTSKLSTEEDLLNIKTYGFRGEALSSIAAVSKVTIRSKIPNALMGFEIVVEGGNIVSETEVGMNSGTQIIVEDLFYNVPARKEFLRSAQSEYKDVLKTVNAHALANPKVGFIFRNDQKQVYVTPKGHQLEDRIREILGTDNTEKMVSLFYEHPYVEIYGYVGKPELATQKRKNQFIFVNNRLIQNKTIEGAVKKAYGGLIPNNMWPPFVIFIDLEPNIVDVNVHPRKEEVKFSNGQLIFTSVQSAVKKALDKANLTPGAINNEETQPSNNPFANLPSPFGNNKPNPFGDNKPNPFANRPSPFGNNKPSPFENAKPNPFANKPTPIGGNKNLPNQDNLWANNNPFDLDNNDFNEDQPLDNLDYSDILVIHNLYWIIESKDGFLVYDQHAVHERILYEKFVNAHKKKREELEIQPLLTPIVLNLSFDTAETMKEYIGELEKIGFQIEEFGGTSYKVTEIPAILADKDIKKVISEFLNDLEDNQDEKDIDSQTDRALKFLSCRSAYKAGDKIPPEEINELLNQLKQTETKYTCPHGRPVKIEITKKELEKMFLRKL